jgi:aspartate/methionine/tyrosine aminotransferase
VDGLAELRRVWRERQRQGVPPEVPSSLPIVTLGTAHARALAADLFAAEGRPVVLPEPCRIGDRELFEQRHGARVLPAVRALAEVPDGEPAIVVLDERETLVASLADAAGRRPLVVIVDDTWEDQGGSRFWSLIGLHPNLIPVKVDGADGSLGFPGGRVGFLTLPFAPESPLALALESKLKMLLRAAVGSPSAATQTILLQALRDRALSNTR